MELPAWDTIVTAPMFAEKGYRVVIVDVPSDRKSGMGDDFRKSDSHAQDIGRLIEEIASRGVDSFYLLGTSRWPSSGFRSMPGVVPTRVLRCQGEGGGGDRPLVIR
jgi:hypothetical protein